jgi:hypothetical protein
MGVRQTIRAERFHQGPKLVGVMLPGFNGNELESVRRGFHSAAPCHLQHAASVV